ncbi:PEAR1-like protein [Mya arenaria]|uniref:PEAR1-like protein n=1 Tax=Mya arenaria TaxID=6604 RepID=A0ABY7F6W8_MYAAR|nr:PEAR1-like protein [Mya arenaria]
MEIWYNVLVLCLIFVQARVVCGQWGKCWYCGCCADGQDPICTYNYCQHGCINGQSGSYCDRKCSSEHCVKCHRSDVNYCLECNSGFYGSRCEYCGTNCADCMQTGCQSCVDGYWGQTCYKKCREHCLTCQKRNGACISCKPGYHGHWCDSRCGDRCLKCDKLNGNCIACENEFWGDTCIACGNNCKICNQSHGCLECNVGFYGKTCDTYCGLHCQMCDISYNCSECRPGYYKYNNNCEECQLKQNGCTCTSGVQCSGCVDGYFLNDQFCSKCPDHCTTCKKSSSSSSLCFSCTSGWFGQTCQYWCSDYCTNGICDENNAVCRCSQNYKGETCDQCADGRFGEICEHNCSLGCESGNCTREIGFCLCKSGWSGQRCDTCTNDYFGDNCDFKCEPNCVSCNGHFDCQSCMAGKYGTVCQLTCPKGCLEDICDISDGSCHSCKDGYFGTHCNNTCPQKCQTCDVNGQCLTCKSGSLSLQSQCNCRIDMCVNEQVCNSCKNSSFFVDSGECCPCDIAECLSCAKINDSVICRICNGGFFSSKRGRCLKCYSICNEHACNSSTGKCQRGCTDGYWSDTCEEDCDPECKSCRQVDGLCTTCMDSTKHGSHCNLACSATCMNSVCDIDGYCSNGCILNTFGKQCENACDAHCISNRDSTVCSEQTGMCLIGCDPGYRGEVCPEAYSTNKVIETKTEKQTTTPSIATLGGGIGGGIVALSAIVILALFLHRRKGNFSNKIETPEKEPENIATLYATVNKGRFYRAEYANGDTDNLHSVTIIDNHNNQSPPPTCSDKERAPILTEDNLEIDENDASAGKTAGIFEDNCGVYYNNAKEVRKLKVMVADLPEHKLPYGLVKPYEVSQTKLNMHRNRYKGIYPCKNSLVFLNQMNFVSFDA